MNTVSKRYVHRATLTVSALGLAGAFLAPGAAATEPAQKIALDFAKGRCGKTTLLARSGVPTTLEITTSDNFTDGAVIELPGNAVALPDTYRPVTTSVDLGVPGPGVMNFKVSSPEWPGSAGTGCTGRIVLSPVTPDSLQQLPTVPQLQVPQVQVPQLPIG
ncbi:hypothetical protein [Nocardia crassostreae]|uniref:hypothetical protein n=1 Tax=Nocardia crassostreae TaxID=53428 RepID=UPI0012F97EA9|nr:hypothetical protein [Nocardia crassostreae]